MRRLSEILRGNIGYFIAFICIAVLIGVLQLFYSQTQLFLLINGFNSWSLDILFYGITYLGDGITFAILILIMAFYSYRKATLGLIVFLSTSLVAQLLKRVFSDHLRPFALLGQQYNLHIPDHVTPLMNNSFPSGHTATAFALATFIVLLNSSKRLWQPVIILAVLVGYSRVYLTHHFVLDVWAGAVIGTVGAVVVYWLANQWLDTKMGEKSLLRR